MRKVKIILPIIIIGFSMIAYSLFVRPHISKEDISKLLNGKTISEFKILNWQTSTAHWGPCLYKKAIIKVTVSEKEYYLLNIQSSPLSVNDLDDKKWSIPYYFDFFPVDSLKFSVEPKSMDIQEFIKKSSYLINGSDINLW